MIIALKNIRMYLLIAAVFPEIIIKIVKKNTEIVSYIIISESENARAISKSHIITIIYNCIRAIIF